jgi:rfaE bifunctional protein kinase chain/domain
MDQNRLIEIVNAFSSKRIAVVGDLILDGYTLGTKREGNPEGDGPIYTFGTKDIDFRLGGAANVAANMAGLGGNVHLYGQVGNDFYAQKLEELCAHIPHAFVRDGITPFKNRVYDRAEGLKHYKDRHDFEEPSPIRADLANTLMKSIEFAGIDALAVADYNKHLFRGESDFGQRIIKLANQRGWISVVDPKPMNAIKFRGASVVRPNKDEASKIVGETTSDEEMVRKLKEYCQSQYAVVTRGEKGAIVYDGGFHNIPTQARQKVDVVGAGDTFIAAMTLALASNASISEAATIANYASGIAVEKQGTAVVTKEDLIQRILGK